MGPRFLFVLFASVLAFAMPEVFAGSSPSWALSPFALILTIPLYAAHFFLLAHVAVRTRRVSWPALYLFGVIFGLYETWITKVVWHGYAGQPGLAIGGLGPWFGVHESLGLVLFYHPVTSFLLPLATLAHWFPPWGRHFPATAWLWGNGRNPRLLRIGLVAIYGVSSGNNLQPLSVYLLTWAPTLAILFGGYAWLRAIGRAAEPSQAARPILNWPGLAIAFVVLIAIYVWSYGHLLPERLPPLPVQLATLALYGVVGLMILALGPTTPEAPRDAAPDPARPLVFIGAVALVALAVVLLYPLVPSIMQGAAGLAFLAMIPAGVLLFLALPIRALVRRLRDRPAGEPSR